ncbi:MAG TPA: RusA family crossover junction endodeoxyribonuclease [Candidatus Limnocylindrales bacterium]
MTAIAFTVVGTPVPQGSTAAFSRGGKIHTTNDPKGTINRWRGDVRGAAGPAIGAWTGPELPLPGPVSMRLRFRFARPKSHFHPANSRRAVEELKADAPSWLAGTPDVDKLSRSILDALTALVYVDDAQVVALNATKRYVGEGERPGVDVVVEAIER